MAAGRGMAALHEGGHGAAILAVGENIKYLAVDAHGGGVTSNRHSLMFGTTIRRKEMLQIALAGVVTESRYCWASAENLLQGQTGWGGEGDGDIVKEILNGDSLSSWIRKTDRVLSGYRREIETLAEALDVYGRVDGRTATAILTGRR